jgi:hypothetical protein
MRRHRLLAAALVACAAAAPAADAATVTVDRPCVRTGTQVGFALSGFAPGLVDLLVGDNYLDTVEVDASGGFAGTFSAPGISGTSGSFTLSTRSGGSAPFSVTETGATQRPAAPKPGGKVTLNAYGFVEGGTLYAHYVFHPSDTRYQAKKHVRLGALTGACGNLTKKVAALPVKKPAAGVWLVQVDPRPAYRKQVAPYAELSVFVPKKR